MQRVDDRTPRWREKGVDTDVGARLVARASACCVYSDAVGLHAQLMGEVDCVYVGRIGPYK